MVSQDEEQAVTYWLKEDLVSVDGSLTCVLHGPTPKG